MFKFNIYIFCFVVLFIYFTFICCLCIKFTNYQFKLIKVSYIQLLRSIQILFSNEVL
jgi:hypothetical protein